MSIKDSVQAAVGWRTSRHSTAVPRLAGHGVACVQVLAGALSPDGSFTGSNGSVLVPSDTEDFEYRLGRYLVEHAAVVAEIQKITRHAWRLTLKIGGREAALKLGFDGSHGPGSVGTRESPDAATPVGRQATAQRPRAIPFGQKWKTPMGPR